MPSKGSHQNENDEGEATKATPDEEPYLIFGHPAFSIWRFCFYTLMAYDWGGKFLGPCGGPFMDSTTYDHAEWVYETVPKTPEQVQKLRWFGVACALLSTKNNAATVVFAVLTGQHIFSNISMFINHNYLFFLLSLLMAICCNFGKHNNHDKAGWIHALRGQIVVVYAYAALWKFDPDWINGDIVKGIFLSFERQGANRGVPWAEIYAEHPGVFHFVGVSGLLLDSTLFAVLMFLPPGHKLQRLSFVFHGFTGYTMSQRIGYSFPLAMIFAGFIFQRSGVIEKDQESIGGDSLSHAKWLMYQMKLWTTRSKSEETKKQRVKKRHFFPLLYLLIQWLVPLRMPFVSLGEFKYTFEGYRWSWTMMLHTKVSMPFMGLSLMTLRPKCGQSPFPNMQAQKYPFMDINSFPYEMGLVNKPRSLSVLQMFARQMPKLAHNANKMIGEGACPFEMSMTSSYFSSTNGGPYHRIIDPTSDLLEVHRTHVNLPWKSKLWYSMIDKAPPGQEFILRGTGSINIPLGPKDSKGEVTLVDRSPCLQADPIRVHNNHFNIQFDSNSDDDFRLLLRGCPELNLQNCKEIYLEKGEQMHLSAIRTVMIGMDKQENLGTSCSEAKEDVVIKLTQIQPMGMQTQH